MTTEKKIKVFCSAKQKMSSLRPALYLSQPFILINGSTLPFWQGPFSNAWIRNSCWAGVKSGALTPISAFPLPQRTLPPPAGSHTELIAIRFNWANESLITRDLNQNKAIEVGPCWHWSWKNVFEFWRPTSSQTLKEKQRLEKIVSTRRKTLIFFFFFYKLLTRHNYTLCFVSGRDHKFFFWPKLNFCDFLFFSTDSFDGQLLKWSPPSGTQSWVVHTRGVYTGFTGLLLSNEI